MRISFFCCAFASAVLCLQAQTVSAPLAGTILNKREALVSVRGVLGALLPGEPLQLDPGAPLGRVLDAAFPGSSGALKTSSSVLVIGADRHLQTVLPAPSGHALFSFTADGQLAWIYFASTNRLIQAGGNVSWDASKFGGSPVALGPTSSNSFEILVGNESQFWAETIDTQTGSVSKQTPIDGSTPALAFAGGWLTTSTDSGLLWQASDSNTRHIDIKEPIDSLQTAGPNVAVINGTLLLTENWDVLEIPVAPRVRPEVSGKIPPPGNRAGDKL